MAKKDNKNKPLLWGSVFLLGIVLLLVVVNYFVTNIEWANTNLVGLNFTKQEKDSDYFGEKYLCDDDKILYIDIKGSWNNVRNRTAQLTMIDHFSGAAKVENMKLKDVTDKVTYVYKENALVIDKNDVATFLINDIVVLRNCIKN